MAMLNPSAVMFLILRVAASSSFSVTIEAKTTGFVGSGLEKYTLKIGDTIMV
jgi:hypothetical protein